MYEDVVALSQGNGRVQVNASPTEGEEGRERESMWEERGVWGRRGRVHVGECMTPPCVKTRSLYRSSIFTVFGKPTHVLQHAPTGSKDTPEIPHIDIGLRQ